METVCIFFKNFKKTLALRVNKTGLTSRNDFIDNIFALGSKKELKN